MKKRTVEVNGVVYEVTNDANGVFDEALFLEKYTDYFTGFDYIVGDISYNKLRLKGFYDSDNPKVKLINDIKNLDDYIQNFCAFGCKHYVLKKVKTSKN